MDGINNDPVEVGNMKDEDNNEGNRAIGVVNGPLPPWNNDGDRIEQLAKEVFENDLLREKILTHVIQNDESSYRDVCSIRLVQKSWTKDVSRILTGLRKPLYRIELNENNSLNGSDYVRKHGMKILDNFISTVALSPSRIENVVPPFSLSIDPYFFQAENHESFSNLLTGGSTAGLVELEVNIPKNGGSMDFVFNRIPSFPILQNLKVKFCRYGEDQIELQPGVVQHGSNSYFIPFLQSVLREANELRVFSLSGSCSAIPAGVQYLTRPKSLTNLTLKYGLSGTQLESLTMNYLPNLTHLSLPIYHNMAITNNHIFRILDQYKKTLRNLVFNGPYLKAKYIPKVVTQFHFPIMERLEWFSSNCIFAELEPELDGDLQTCLPKLKRLSLCHQTVEMLRKWTVNSCYATVTDLGVSLVDDNTRWTQMNYQATIPLEEMKTIHMAFPNVNVLSITVSGAETSGLKYLFLEMKQLTKLTIQVWHTFNFTNWDSLLTGIPVHIAETLALNSQFWEFVNTIDIKVEESSLKNLNQLQCLRLIARTRHDHTKVPCCKWGDASLISDTVFHLAFLKMPNLKKLLLEGAFKASDEMARRWKAENRKFEYKEF